MTATPKVREELVAKLAEMICENRTLALTDFRAANKIFNEIAAFCEWHTITRAEKRIASNEAWRLTAQH